MFSRKPFDFDHFALLQFIVDPGQTIDPLIGLRASGVVHQAVVLKGTIIDFTVSFALQHHLLGRIPSVHQDRPEREGFLINDVAQHRQQMVQFALPSAVGIINPIVKNSQDG